MTEIRLSQGEVDFVTEISPVREPVAAYIISLRPGIEYGYSDLHSQVTRGLLGYEPQNTYDKGVPSANLWPLFQRVGRVQESGVVNLNEQADSVSVNYESQIIAATMLYMSQQASQHQRRLNMTDVLGTSRDDTPVTLNSFRIIQYLFNNALNVGVTPIHIGRELQLTPAIISGRLNKWGDLSFIHYESRDREGPRSIFIHQGIRWEGVDTSDLTFPELAQQILGVLEYGDNGLNINQIVEGLARSGRSLNHTTMISTAMNELSALGLVQIRGNRTHASILEPSEEGQISRSAAHLNTSRLKILHRLFEVVSDFAENRKYALEKYEYLVKRYQRNPELMRALIQRD